MSTPQKSDVVSSIRALQAQNGVRVYAESTLARMKANDLSDLEESLLAQMRSAAEEAEAPTPVNGETETSQGAKRSGGRRLFEDDAIIRVVGTVTGREGSAALARRQLLGDGMTVAAFVASVEAKTGSTVGARRTVRKALRKGLVRLEGGSPSAATEETEVEKDELLAYSPMFPPMISDGYPGYPFVDAVAA
jgi:hypothetical protein